MRLLGLVFLFAMVEAHRRNHEASKSYEREEIDCDSKSKTIARYRITFKAVWTEKRFPKQFPRVRPPAQWSQLIGRSHNEGYKLWSKGAEASEGMKKFAENGDASEIQAGESQGYNGLWDSFASAPLEKSDGEVSVDFFANGNFSKISAAAKMIPSPDWFVGIDSVPLCRNGSWVDAFTVALSPMDAGTDKGFTFTSPNWASHPPEKIFEITSTFPDHRANSFYYPTLTRLPHIGYMIVKLLDVHREEYVRRTVSHWKEFETDEEEATRLGIEQREKMEEQLLEAGEPLGTTAKLSALPPRSRYSSNVSRSEMFQRDESDNNKKKQDCVVGEWSDWSVCSKTCGFGVQKRYRKVLQIPHNGYPCPNLEQEKWCGSMRNCREAGNRKRLFTWLDKEGNKREKVVPVRRIHHRRRQS